MGVEYIIVIAVISFIIGFRIGESLQKHENKH